MKRKLTPRERIARMLTGEPIDRAPYAAWGHLMNYCDLHAKDFANATIAFQDLNQFDFIKVMSNPYYMDEDLGVRIEPVKDYATPVFRSPDHLVITEDSDWGNLTFPKVGQGALAREKEAIRQIVDHYKGEVPVIVTIFTPLTNLLYLIMRPGEIDDACERDGFYIPALETLLHENEEQVQKVLAKLEEANRLYMQDLLEIGVDGFFYCTEFARSEWTKEMFDLYCKQYDLRTLEAVKDKSFFNILHFCGKEHLMPEWIIDYPVEVLNWDDQEEQNPSLAAMRKMSDKVLLGGVNRHQDLAGSDRDKIKDTLQKRLKEAKEHAGEKLILSGGCDWQMDAAFKFFIWKEVMEEAAEEIE